MNSYKAKQELRRCMASRKKEYPADRLSEWSARIMERLEQTAAFQEASCVALYHALPGEVQTAAFIGKWYKTKRILLPVVEGDDLRLLPYTGKDSLTTGAFGILEPTATGKATEEKEVGLIIVPGVAFDRQCNRMGRGKGFYDRLLSTLPATKIGICYGFQLQDEIPVEPFDRKMDGVITEDEQFGLPAIRLI